ncbi:aspartyl/glutamyl-tRNA(Asn/Gln) amidotransferase subunit B [Pseudohyphozyma bogoriensis]|nr:aspartyl/glutamyl-tRNA(Asn/Gln) amidotransferase subunit B [Pseudohyphozyma bogoriensis]
MFSLRLTTPLTASLRTYATAPSTLDTSLRTALKTAMKARDTFASTTIKSVLADLQNAGHLSSPPPPHKTLAKAITSRVEGAKLLSGNPALAEQYLKEAEILKAFAEPEPEGMDVESIEKLVREVMGEMGLTEIGKNMGRVVKAVMEKGEGKALGKQVSEVVKRLSSSA